MNAGWNISIEGNYTEGKGAMPETRMNGENLANGIHEVMLIV